MQINYSKQSIKFLKKQETGLRRKIVESINLLPSGDVKKLKGTHSQYRLRIGDIRVIFDRQGNILYIEKIAFRGKVYKQ